MEIRQGERILDLACGQGLFARAFHEAGGKVVAADISKELIDIARTKSDSSAQTSEQFLSGKRILNGQAAKKSSKNIAYHVASAHALPFLQNESIDKVAIVLAIQNIENLNGTLSECARILAPHGKLYTVLNHPAFRIPRESSWGFDEKASVQYRRIDRYLSNAKIEIKMHPGLNASFGRVGRILDETESRGVLGKQQVTLSFHRPLQTYAKALFKQNFCMRRLEEWSSTKTSQKGPRAEAENRARKEIPLFLTIEAQKMSRAD